MKWLAWSKTLARIGILETRSNWNALGALAQTFYGDHQRRDYDALLGDLTMAKAAIVYQMSTRSNVSLCGVAWYGKHTLERMIQLNTATPYANTTLRLRRWSKQDGF